MQQPIDSSQLPPVVMPVQEIPQLLKGQKALVTGASSGIGRAVAIALGHAGADVVINYGREEDAAKEAAVEAGAKGSKSYIHQADVSKEDQVVGMFAKMIQEFGTIDILVNNAGLQQDSPLEQMTLAQWQKVIDVNLTGQFLCAREAVREFKRRGVGGECVVRGGEDHSHEQRA